MTSKSTFTFGRLVPSKIKSTIKRWLFLIAIKGNLYKCPVCGAGINAFNRLPDYFIKELDAHQYMYSILAEETLNVLSFECPLCGAYDRDRLCAIYYEELFRTLNPARTYQFIEFAPSRYLKQQVLKYPNLRYRSADLIRNDVDNQVNIVHMPNYADMSIDFFICSHVLEHVQNDRAAMSELFRILKPDGLGIIMVPILLTLNENYENPELTTEADRWRHFGQHDHVRIYSKTEFVKRLSEAGFKVSQLDVNHFGISVFQRHGIHPRSVLYVVSKTST